ncbi:hypothetical protein [Rubidibacter lacunae]|uniref:hypothetical protein n=1 Tax=Rubidibacter lacunae TaxID=582514 RepID=UPI000407F002|nr:hypothetical protein [Rubidibacter lacunae]
MLVEADLVTVGVKTYPNLLAQDKLATLVIAGVELIMQQNLRMQELQIRLKCIAVNPWKALMINVDPHWRRGLRYLEIGLVAWSIG